ncbi:MAG: flippase [Candidatus Dormibacteria bacterium]
MAARVASNALLLLSARTLSKIAVFFSVILTLRALHPDGYGQFTAIVVLGNVASIVADLGLQTVFVREGSRHRDELGRYLGVTLAAKLPLALAGGLVLILITALFAHDLLFLVGPTLVLVLVTGTGNVLRSCFFARGEMRYEVYAIGVETGVLLVLTVLFSQTHQGVAAFIWAYAASYTAAGAFAAAVVTRRYTPIRLRFESVLLRRTVRQSLPFAIAFVLGTLYFRIDVVLLRDLTRSPDPNRQVGIYSAAVKFIDGITFIPQAVMNAVYPALSVLSGEGVAPFRRAYERAYRLLAALGMPATVGFVILAPAIVRYTHVFRESATSLRILGISLFLIFVVNSFLYVLGALDRQANFIVLTGLSVTFNVVLNVIVIPRFPVERGYDATSWTTVATELFLFVLGYIALSRALGRLAFFRPILPILLSGAVMAAVMYPLRNRAPIPDAVLGLAVYSVAMVLSRGVTRDELRMGEGIIRARLGRPRPAP